MSSKETKRIKCPKEWKFVKIVIDNKHILYRKIRKVTKYYYAANVSSSLINKDSKVILENAKKEWPFCFSSKLIKENRSHCYLIVPWEIVSILGLKDKDILKFVLGNHVLYGRLRKKCHSHVLLVKTHVKDSLKDKITKVSLTEKMNLDTPKSNVTLKNIDDKHYFDLGYCLPKTTSRDGIPFKVKEISQDSLLICAEFSHVKGRDFKYIELPRYIPSEELMLLLGLMHSDGFKKFGFKEVYNKHIFSPYVGFTNGDPFVINLFLKLFEETFNIPKKLFSFNLMYPFELNKKKELYLTRFWNSYLCSNNIRVYKNEPRTKRWCPAGILKVGIYNILLAEIVICLLKSLSKWLTKQNSYKKLLNQFLIGVMIGDGSPILDKGTLRRFMIAIEFREEGELYKTLLSRIGLVSRNLWPQDEKATVTYNRKIDIRGPLIFLKEVTNKIPFGFWSNKTFLGSIEKYYSTLKGLLKHSRLDSIEKKYIKKELKKVGRVYKRYLLTIHPVLPLSSYYKDVLKNE